MDEDTRIAALKKLVGMKSVVAYPDEFVDDSSIEKYYNHLEMEPDQFLQNILNVRRVSYMNKISKLREPMIDRNDWTDIGGSIAEVNAFYWPELNTIGNKSKIESFLNTSYNINIHGIYKLKKNRILQCYQPEFCKVDFTINTDHST